MYVPRKVFWGPSSNSGPYYIKEYKNCETSTFVVFFFLREEMYKPENEI